MQRARILPMIVLVALAAGCNIKIDPSTLKALTPAAKPSAEASAKPGAKETEQPNNPQYGKLGNVTGFVLGQSGKSQPIPLAEVRAGSVKALAGNPDPSKAVPEEDEFNNPADANRDNFDVMHDFNDGAGPVPTQRILRKNVPGTSPDMDDAAKARVRYVYLRAGEFFLEGLPAGDASLVAKFGSRESQPNPVTVYANQLVTDVTMSISIPEPVVIEDGRVPKVVEWVGTKPDTGISVAVSVKTTQTDAGTQTEATMTYKPDPPDVEISLAAPPGSGGAVIKAYDLVYVYNTPARQAAGQPPLQLGPTRVPISALTVPPAGQIDFGPDVKIHVPLGSADLKHVFFGASPSEQPGMVMANIEFIDDAGFAIQDKSFQNLQVGVPIRAL